MEKIIKRQQFTGIVVSDKMDKTVTVEITRHKRHPKYHKSYTEKIRLKAHDEDNSYHTGDTVTIESSRPISKDKKFKVISKA